ncbi:MAG TPA: PVC-type heme-binding CxxCH protein [Planctomycetota bacterium]|nr:PVC-type heme-binding CxxCH protein [Planctomycetota bacterium]
MKRLLVLAIHVLMLTAPFCAAGEILDSLKVPEGFVVEQVAGPPLLLYPMFACFDENGQLYVAESSGFCGTKTFNPEVAKHLKEPPHFIRRIEDTDGDGRFDRGTIFADKLTYPQGVACEDGVVFTVSPPSVWRLEDTDNDGVADKRIELFTGIKLTAIADDGHGPTIGPDGRLYWINAHQGHARVQRPGGPVLNTETFTQIFRCRQDGSDFETFSGCLGNPAEVAFNAAGDCFATGTFGMTVSDFNRSAWNRQDGTVHCIEGGAYPRLNGNLTSIFMRTGIVLPQMSFHGTSAASGMAVYHGAQWGTEYSGNMFTTQFNLHKVLRLVTRKQGSTYTAEAVEFLSSSRNDFFPTDVIQDADGSLLVIDTGGWYIHCPTASSAKAASSGGIYRIRKKDAPPVADPWGKALDWSNPQAYLDDPRWAVRERAIRMLAKKGSAKIEGAPEARVAAVWALTRSSGDVTPALRDADASVRAAGAKAAGLLKDVRAGDALLAALSDSDPFVRREAATALGRLNDKRAVPHLLKAAGAAGDDFQRHAIVLALIRLGDSEALIGALSDPQAEVRLAALLALDRLENSGLSAEKVAALLDPRHSVLQSTALQILTRRGWSGAVITQARQWLASGELNPARADLLRHILQTLAADQGMQDELARLLRDPATQSSVRMFIFETMAQMPLERFPATWQAEARWAIDSGDEKIVLSALALLRAAHCADFGSSLQAIARDEKRSTEVRLEAAAVLAFQLKDLPKQLFAFVQGCLAREQPPLLRLNAARILAHATLSDSQLSSLSSSLEKAGPLELPRLFAAFERSSNKDVGKKLVAALSQNPASRSIPAAELARIFKKFPEDVQRAAEALKKNAGEDAEEIGARIQSLMSTLGEGNAQRGRDVFFGQKALCSTCHALDGKGERIGPDLSKIGAVRARRDLLEAIVFPSATFARNFEPYLFKTQDGRTVTGIVREETPAALVVFSSDRTEVRLPRSEIVTMNPASVSIMPQGLDSQMSAAEFADLLAFLQSLK